MSTVNDSNSSLPDVPGEFSWGSSVSSGFVNEYEEILKYAIVAPRLQVGDDVYLKQPAPQNETSSLCSNKESTSEEDNNARMTQNFRLESKIIQAKESVENVSQKSVYFEKKQLCFNVPNALDTLLEYSDTPVKEKPAAMPAQQTDSTSASPDSAYGAPSPPSVDKDLLQMDSLMDDWCLQLKRNVLAELADMKTRQFQHEENAIHQLKSKHNAEILRLAHEVESLKELLYTFEQNVKQKDEVIKNLTEALSKQKERADKIRLFSMWRLKHNDEQRQAFSSKMADKFYNKTLTSKVWTGWRSVVETKWKQRVEKACQIKSQEVCLKLTEDYEERLQALQRELASARSEVAKMHTERDCYEENMKKAFMRGVCALNMEAMSMFKEGKPGDENDTGQSHHSCIPPSTPASAMQSSEVTSSRLATHTDDPTVCKQQEVPTSKKHVTFDQAPQEIVYTSKKHTTSTISNNRKDLHVKMTTKKDYGAARKDKRIGASNQSSISSVKVERHMPHDLTAFNPVTTHTHHNRDQNPYNGYTAKRHTHISVPSVKVVD